MTFTDSFLVEFVDVDGTGGSKVFGVAGFGVVFGIDLGGFALDGRVTLEDDI